uniref:Uncharacterized protein n=1 Tax=Anguilla anguilla TaxID=7936 RepID=A0A0E9QVK2_ANGAN
MVFKHRHVVCKTQLQYHNFNKFHFLKCENVTFSSWHVAYSNFLSG